MKERVDSKLIRKYTEGKYSFSDLKQLACWFGNFKYHSDIKLVIKSHWDEFEFDSENTEKDLSAVFNRLKEKILTEKIRLSLPQKINRVYARVAAILLLPLLLYSTYSIVDRYSNQNETWVEIVSPKGTRTHFDLPDGTKVSLNSGSRLKYDLEFENHRQVKLEGEAYFDVFHNVASPFVVQTNILDVLVVGTKFSVASYGYENSVDVILKEGKVLLTGKETDFTKELKPNEGFFYNKVTHRGHVSIVDAAYLTAWKDGLLILRNEPLGEVMKRIERWYNVRFEVMDDAVRKFHYRATFKDEPIEEVLRLIELTAPVNFEIKDRNLDQDGAYSEKVIIVTMKK